MQICISETNGVTKKQKDLFFKGVCKGIILGESPDTTLLSVSTDKHSMGSHDGCFPDGHQRFGATDGSMKHF